MSDNVKLTYRREGEKFVGLIEHGALMFEFKNGIGFAEMMTHAHRFLVDAPQAGLLITRTERPNMLPVQLEPTLLKLLREDPVAYIKANSIPPRIIDLREGQKTSKLADGERYDMPRNVHLRHGLDTLADAFGEMVYAKAKQVGGFWRFEHPGTGRWADLPTIEHWFGKRASGYVLPIDATDPKLATRGYLTLNVEDLLRTNAERFYYPREWNEFGSWISKDQLAAKLAQFRKDKSNVDRK